jgi:hypothetical protein
MKTCGEVASALDGSEWSALRHHFSPLGRAPGTHCLAGWVGSRAGLDAMEKRTILILPGIEPPAVQPLAHCYTD